MLFLFIVCIAVACTGLGFISAALIAGPASYDRGWRDRGRQEEALAADRRRALTVVR